MNVKTFARESFLLSLLAVMLSLGGPQCVVASSIGGLSFAYPVNRLKLGESLGNSDCYVTLDRNTSVLSDRSSVRFGLREATNQRYYLVGWNVSVSTADGSPFIPVTTILSPAYQETDFRAPGIALSQLFFLPFENGYARSAHFLFSTTGNPKLGMSIQSQISLPANSKVSESILKGHKFLTVRYSDGAESILWGSGSIALLIVRDKPGEETDVIASFRWSPVTSSRQYALSFAYSLVGGPEAQQMLLNAIFDTNDPASPNPATHTFRVHKLLNDSVMAIDRYLGTARLYTPDPVINRGYDWAKVNQLRVRQEYKWGEGFSNNPPSDIVVGRDSCWYLSGSSYYAQPWSRKLLDLWFRKGRELNGKFVEYMTASRDPIFEDDYGLNINDNTPLLVLAACRYYALTGDIAFLRDVYPQLLDAANYILSQRWVGRKNHYGLVWCTSEEKFVRGLCGWRNAIRNYNLSGAVTEVNAECYQALLQTAELAHALGDEASSTRLMTSANDLRQAVQKYLRATGPINQFYCLNINPSGHRVDDMTCDLLFPVLEGVADKSLGQQIAQELFSSRFWLGSSTGAGGIRTVSSAQSGYEPVSTLQNYGLLGGVWPNVALWAGEAAARQGLPDLAAEALRATFLLSARTDPAHYNVVPGEFPEYFDGDDLIQRGMPLSPFVPGIYIWSALEGLAGISPHPTSFQIDPALPRGWNWIGVANLPYKGNPLTLLADGRSRILYTTVPVQSNWKQVLVPEEAQKKFIFVSDRPAFALVVPRGNHYELLAAAAEPTTGEVKNRETGRTIQKISIPARALLKIALQHRTVKVQN